MDTSDWNRMDKVNKYLAAKKEAGIRGFKELFKQLESASATLAVITFTYENLEVYIKNNLKNTIELISI